MAATSKAESQDQTPLLVPARAIKTSDPDGESTSCCAQLVGCPMAWVGMVQFWFAPVNLKSRMGLLVASTVMCNVGIYLRQHYFNVYYKVMFATLSLQVFVTLAWAVYAFCGQGFRSWWPDVTKLVPALKSGGPSMVQGFSLDYLTMFLTSLLAVTFLGTLGGFFVLLLGSTPSLLYAATCTGSTGQSMAQGISFIVLAVVGFGIWLPSQKPWVDADDHVGRAQATVAMAEGFVNKNIAFITISILIVFIPLASEIGAWFSEIRGLNVIVLQPVLFMVVFSISKQVGASTAFWIGVFKLTMPAGGGTGFDKFGMCPANLPVWMDPLSFSQHAHKAVGVLMAAMAAYNLLKIPMWYLFPHKKDAFSAVLLGCAKNPPIKCMTPRWWRIGHVCLGASIQAMIALVCLGFMPYTGLVMPTSASILALTTLPFASDLFELNKNVTPAGTAFAANLPIIGLVILGSAAMIAVHMGVFEEDHAACVFWLLALAVNLAPLAEFPVLGLLLVSGKCPFQNPGRLEVLPGITMPKDFSTCTVVEQVIDFSSFGETATVVENGVDVGSWINDNLSGKKVSDSAMKAVQEKFQSNLNIHESQSAIKFNQFPDPMDFQTLSTMLKVCPFYASAISADKDAKGEQKLCIRSLPPSNEKGEYSSAGKKAFGLHPGYEHFASVISCMNPETYPRFKVWLSNDLDVERVDMYRYEGLDASSGTQKWSLYEASEQDKLRAVFYLMNFWAETFHLSIHILHFLMVPTLLQAASHDSKASDFAKSYMSQVDFKYEQVKTLLLGADSGIMVESTWHSDKSVLDVQCASLIGTLTRCLTPGKFFNDFLLAGIKDKDVANKLLQQCRKHCELAPGFADEVTKTMSADGDAYALEDWDASLNSMLSETGDGVFPEFRVRDWLILLSMTGVVHGTTFSFQRTLLTSIGVTNKSDGCFDSDIAGLCGTVMGTCSGVRPDMQVFSYLGVPDDLQSIMQAYTQKSVLLAAEYMSQVDVNDPDFIKNGWLYTDWFPNGMFFPAKQLTRTTYV